MSIPFHEVARLPDPGDNTAVVVRRLEAGTEIQMTDRSFRLGGAIPEGHRFAVAPIAMGEPLLSWGLPFGRALRRIEGGEYVCNEGMLTALASRAAGSDLPKDPNFENLKPEGHVLDESAFRPGKQVEAHSGEQCFEGYVREGGRGVGTRNCVVILGTSSRTAGYARALAERFRGVEATWDNIDGVVAVAHTEGGANSVPNNRDMLLRTLAGFLVHPNVGAVLVVDQGSEPVNNLLLGRYLVEEEFPLAAVRHRFLSVGNRYTDALREGEEIVRRWLPDVNETPRTRQPLSHLRIALQCGGSDAFSGVSGNPLAGWIARELIRYGGAANLAETDELIGAEPYVLQNVKDLATARAFLERVAHFQAWAARHGHSAEGNPSGGNLYRGLYNIAIKSIGAARKKMPDVRLDHVIEYSQRMRAPGFYFMDSPGNDLESIAGQVASGCNLILFTTGNGSITNFPFVPTLKIMTSSGRFALLSNEMDINAGRFLDGEPMEALGRESFDLALAVASGQRSAGERAGHSQVQIWRDWPLPEGVTAPETKEPAAPDGKPVSLPESETSARLPEPIACALYRTESGFAADRVGLILPTSLCSGQIAEMIAARLNVLLREKPDYPGGVTRFVSLVHTEGCGASSGEAEEIFLRTLSGYLRHPSVRAALLLEHGCEKTHNDAFRAYLADAGVDFERFGRASIQLDGGLESVFAKVRDWFRSRLSGSGAPARKETCEGRPAVGLLSSGAVPAEAAAAFAGVAETWVRWGGTVVIPATAELLRTTSFTERLFGTDSRQDMAPTLAYGETPHEGGLHIMEAPSDNDVEVLTGLGATGVEAMLAAVEYPIQAHPLVPLLQVGVFRPSPDLDFYITPEKSAAPAIENECLRLLAETVSGRYMPLLFACGNVNFQMTRGRLGVSL